MLQVPPGLTRTSNDGDAKLVVTKFLDCAEPLLRVVIALIKNRDWTPLQAWEREEFVDNLVLMLTAFASGISELDGMRTDAPNLTKLSKEAIVHLSKALQREEEEVSPTLGMDDKSQNDENIKRVDSTSKEETDPILCKLEDGDIRGNSDCNFARKIKTVKPGMKRGDKKVLQSLILKVLPTILPPLRQTVKAGDGSKNEDIALASAIVAAHQMAWCLEQV